MSEVGASSDKIRGEAEWNVRSGTSSDNSYLKLKSITPEGLQL